MSKNGLVDFSRWTHSYICPALPGDGWGTGGIGVADFTGDGRLDVAVSRREPGTAYWFEQRPGDGWVQHIVGSSPHLGDGSGALGATAIDVDHDGWPDLVFGGVWFRNPGTLATRPDSPWEANEFPGKGHDVIAADMNGDGLADIVTYDGTVLAWYDTSRGLEETVIIDGRSDHGGIAPCGFGDIGGNGRLDIVIPGIWLENPGTGRGEWKRHAWPHEPIIGASYGTSMRVWVADMNGDGNQDIVYSDCDTGYSHVYWVQNLCKGKQWLRHRLPDPPGDARTGSFHSLGVADFAGDGRLHIFAGEQEDPDTYMVAEGKLPMKPEGLRERGIIWVSSGGPTPSFSPVVISEGRPGWHDAVVIDMDGDGRPDIVSKIWNADGPTYHLDLWRNGIDRGMASVRVRHR